MYFLIFKNGIYYNNSTKLEIIEMIFFIATIFIAQIIIVWNIVFCLISIDNKINNTILLFDGYAADLPEMLSVIKEMTEDVCKMIQLIKCRLVKYRNKFILCRSRSIAENLALLMFKPKYKKLLVGIKLGIKVTKKLIKRKNMI